jgi:putative colanic acid biosynthesis acetyltransferase WcaF
MKKVDLSRFSNANSNYYPGAPRWKRALWYFVNEIFFRNRLMPLFCIKPVLLRWFGAKVGQSVRIKWGVNVRFPWFLEIGNDVWIGEGVWIDSLARISIGDNVCISQGAYLMTGNHNYKSETFDIIVGDITLEEGVWIGAFSIVGPNVTCKSHSILAVGSVATSDLNAYTIYQGNPAVAKKERVIEY